MDKKRIVLALQGGGSHGAFTWGVLESLLNDERLEIEGFSGTSAGAMNAAAAVQGLIRGGTAGAVKSLEDYWRGVHELARRVAPLSFDPIGTSSGNYNLDTSPAMLLKPWLGPFLAHYSPYTHNPENANPFRDFVGSFFDFEALRNCERWKMFFAATHVGTGKIKLFTNADISLDVLMATTCLPTAFQAVEVDGEYYWDGGYIANPAIFPLINECTAKDIVVVQLTKSYIAHLPKQRAQILDRFSEITFNSCLVREIRAVYFMTRLLDEGKVVDPSLRRINLHVIKDDTTFNGLSSASTMNTDWVFLHKLRRAGQRSGEKWIRDYYDELGQDMPFHKIVFDDYI